MICNQDFVRISTHDMPEVCFNRKKEIYRVSGRSLSETPEPYFLDMMEWITSLLQETEQSIKLDIELEYLNSSSARYFLGLFKKLEEFPKERVSVLWRYSEDDDLMMEKGQLFEVLTTLDLRVLPSAAIA